MSAPVSQSTPVGPDTPIAIKVIFDGSNRRFKLPLRELGAFTLPQKLRQVLSIPRDVDVTLERYSDSAGCFVVLDSENPSVYKQLFRAAKAKLKLRIKVTVVGPPSYEALQAPEDPDSSTQPAQPRCSYFDTVLSAPAATQPAGSPLISGPPPHTHVPKAETHGTPANFIDDQKVLAGDHPEVPSLPTQTGSASSAISPNPAPFSEAFGESFCIDCNRCKRSIPNEHFHCSICDDGDYDLCQACVDAGVLCPGEGHWLIKRSVEDGVVTNSTTETIPPKKNVQPSAESEILCGATAPSGADETGAGERTCNACFRDFNEAKMVTCHDCPDYDLCFTCLLEDRHGHHPGHTFSLLYDRNFRLKSLVMSCCLPGRSYHHAAICDGCDLNIVGVRNKCLSCPDWDFCSDCFKNASEIHPGHRFVPIYRAISEPQRSRETHFGILCDGPLCKDKPSPGYISGIRYKCAVCHDTDFCATCEAHPTNTHNRTHPLIKLKTPVRHVSVSTFGEGGNGERLATMGDRTETRSTSTETIPTPISNAATQVHNETEGERSPTTKQSLEGEKLTEIVDNPLEPKLEAFFVRDTIPDGSKVPPSKVLTQTWTLYNPGPYPWPKGCSVRFVGGDGMFNVDMNHPSSVSSLFSAMESTELSTPIGPFGMADFTVTLKTPQREGRAISYWRLKTPDGVAFGHKLWCDIDVQPSAAESQVLLPAETAAKPTVDMSKNIIGDSTTASNDPEGKDDKSLTESAMIFPKLEKESPVASTHEATSPALFVNGQDEHHLEEDVESLTLDDDETDDEFLTDEEYDILDASDQEFTIESQKPDQK